MAYTTLTTKNVGDPVLASDFNLIKDNFDDHESRIGVLEVSVNKVEMFVGTLMNAAYFSTLTRFLPQPVSTDFTATTATFTIDEVGSLTGILEFDIKKTVGTLDPSGAVSIFTTRPSINFATALDYDTSSNFVLDVTTKDFSSGDFFYLEITSMPTGGTLGPVVLNFYGEI